MRDGPLVREGGEMSLQSWGRQALDDLLDLLLPPCCPLCTVQLPTDNNDVFCPACLMQLTPLPAAACRRCAHPYASDESDDHLCGRCLAETKPGFNRVIPAGLLDGSLQEAVHQFKYRDRIDLDRPLGDLLTRQLRAAMIDCDLIVPVPLHYLRLRQRTYNQSLLLARQLARSQQRPVDYRLLQRTRATVPQQGLDAAARQRNLRGAFVATRALAGEHVLLIDDVLTTGATARECGRVLQAAGAAAVTVAVVARARPPR